MAAILSRPQCVKANPEYQIIHAWQWIGRDLRRQSAYVAVVIALISTYFNMHKMVCKYKRGYLENFQTEKKKIKF